MAALDSNCCVCASYGQPKSGASIRSMRPQCDFHQKCGRPQLIVAKSPQSARRTLPLQDAIGRAEKPRVPGPRPPPDAQIESDGGPGVKRIVELLREQSSSAEKNAQSFLDAIAVNWLIAGIDAHAKNYSLLLGKNGVVRLAPLYDLASILPYPNMNLSKVKLAMKVGR